MSDHWPQCLGTHEVGHVQCDGDSSSKKKSERTPCAWRDRCGGFKAHLENISSTADEYLGGQEFDRAEADEFGDQCRGWAKEHEVVGGVAKEKRSGQRPFGARGTCSVAFKEKRQKSQDAADHFVEALMQQFPTRRAQPGTLARLGQFVITDRRTRSRYLAIYCSGVGAQRVPVAVLYPKARTEGVEVRLPITADRWMLGQDSILFAATPISLGAFRCSLGVLGRDQLGRLARTLRAMDRSGGLHLPGVSK